MPERTLVFSSPCHLSVKHRQLVFSPRDKDETRTVPIEDIGFVVLEDSSITISHQLIRTLTEHKVALITCGDNHMPQGLLLPIEGHTTHAEVLRAQLDASKPLQKKPITAKFGWIFFKPYGIRQLWQRFSWC